MKQAWLFSGLLGLPSHRRVSVSGFLLKNGLVPLRWSDFPRRFWRWGGSSKMSIRRPNRSLGPQVRA